jgi:DNA-binding NtrC family response regulator
VLLADDEAEAIMGFRLVLEAEGINHLVDCTDSRELEGLLAARPYSAVLLDLRMPHIRGEELLPRIVADHPDTPVIIVTGANDVETAVSCVRAGAFDYMVKPVENERLVSGVRRAIEFHELHDEYRTFRQLAMSGSLEHPGAFSEIVTQNAGMRAILQYVEAIARTGKPVLITGETGVGKELIARSLHDLSERAGQLVEVNAAGLDDAMFSDTLFGHVRGAFTGAERVREGLIRQAEGGTLLLDEIGDLPQASQVRLLRLLQEFKFLPLGADAPVTADVRVIVATNHDLNQLRAQGSFRSDLFYRLQVHHIHVPPLRERLDDLPMLLKHFMQKAATALGKKPPAYPRELLALLATYSFPGNVRELESMVFDAVSLHKSMTLSTDVFRAKLKQHRETETTARNVGKGLEHQWAPLAHFDVLPTIKEMQQMLIEEAMRRAQGNQTVAADLLGMTPSGLNKALKRARG